MGTVAYMSPEQAQGMDVDSRSDLWSLGCVLYEMVSGQRPFQGQYDQALLYEIVHQEAAPLTSIRAGVPMELEFTVGKCLAKDREDRYQAAKEIALDLRTLAEKLKSGRSTILRTSNPAATVPATVMTGQTLDPAEALLPDSVVVGKRRLQAVYGMAAVLAIALLGVLTIHFSRAPPETQDRTVTRFSFAPEGLRAAYLSSGASISPDGKSVVYAAQTDGESNLWLRSVSDESAHEIPGTAGAIEVFWSPDSSSIGFATNAELKRISIDGGSPITLCELPTTNASDGSGVQYAFTGGTWSPDGERIVFSSNVRLYEIAARGGQPELLSDATGNARFISLYPHFLLTESGPSALVYTASATNASDQWVGVLNLETGERRELGPGSDAFYSLDGYLIHGPTNKNARGLWAWPFSLETLEPTGDPFPISTAGRAAAVSQDGTLAYLDDAARAAGRTLIWRNRAGELIEAIGQPQPSMEDPALSPDGQWIAVSSSERGDRDIWVHDLIRSTATRLTFEVGVEGSPTWSPSGEEITYWNRGSSSSIKSKAADGAGTAVVLVESETFATNSDWSRDGRYLVYQESGSETRADIRYLEFGPDGQAGEPVTFLSTAAAEGSPKLSPNGRFLAYRSNESGRSEIYVRPFPNGTGKRQVSVNGGSQLRWGSDGKELFYVEGEAALMAISVSTEGAFTLGQPQHLFESSDLLQPGGSTPTYDVSADGERFVMIAPVEGEESAPPAIRIVQNWYDEFRERE